MNIFSHVKKMLLRKFTFLRTVETALPVAPSLLLSKIESEIKSAVETKTGSSRINLNTPPKMGKLLLKNKELEIVQEDLL